MAANRIIDDHTELANIGSNTHAQIDTHIAAADDYVDRDGSLALTADWDIGDGRKIHADEIRARDAAGLKLHDDGGNGIFVEDGGNVGVGVSNPDTTLHIGGAGGNTTFTMNLPGTANYRLGSLSTTADWSGTFINCSYVPGMGWYLDRTDRDGWFFKLDMRYAGASRNNGMGLYRIPAGSNPHNDEYSVYSVSNGYAYFRDDIGLGTESPTAQLDINSDIFRVRTTKTPATAGASGNTGDFCWDSGYIYVCTATNTWKRAALATW